MHGKRGRIIEEIIRVTPLDTGQTPPTAPKMCSQTLLKRLKSILDFSIIWKCRFKQGIKSQSSPTTSHGCLWLRSPISQNHGIFWLGKGPTTSIIKVQLQLRNSAPENFPTPPPPSHTLRYHPDIVLDPSSKHWWKEDWEVRAGDLISTPATFPQPEDTLDIDTFVAGEAWSSYHSTGALGSRTNLPSRPPKNDHPCVQIPQ